MNGLLLDTQVVIWWLTSPGRLSRTAVSRIGRSAASVSVVSLWEMLMKAGIGKLRLPAGRPDELIAKQGFRVLPLAATHVVAASQVLAEHRDPYDRLLVGTARAEGLTLVARDAALLEGAAPILGPLLLEV